MALCPYCQKDVLWVEPVTPGDVPRIGDFSVCCECHNLLVFASIKPMVLRKRTVAEKKEASELADMKKVEKQLGIG